MTVIKICLGSSCYVRGNDKTLNLLENYVKEKGKDINLEDKYFKQVVIHYM